MKNELHFVPEAYARGSAASILGYIPRAVLAVGVAILAVIAIYWQTAASMVAMWIGSDTFTHGFVIAPIAMWLVWRERAALASHDARPSWPALVLLAAAGFGWLLGDLASVNVVAQLGLVLMIQLCVPAIAGVAVTRRLLFPLAFLFFAVPIGEFLIPIFIDWTADFTVAAVRLSGVPVYREGNNFVIPSGRWSIVEGCSGVRYLIASVMVGVLFARLFYRSARRRIAFVAVSIAVPIVANWLRAYMIVMLGHLTDNRLAAGVDHVIYGWIFFGIVMLAMFWVGSFWREDIGAPESAARPARSSAIDRSRSLWMATVVAIAVAGIWKPVGAYLDANVHRSAVDLAAVPAQSGWSRDETSFTTFEPKFSGQRATLREVFSRGKQRVALNVAFYRAQSQGDEMVNSTNVIVGANDSSWRMLKHGATTTPWGDQRVKMESATLKAGPTSLDVRRVYWMNGFFTSSDYVAKLLLALNKLAGNGDDSAVIVLYAPFDASPSAVDDFARDMGPAITAALERASAR